MKKFYFLFFVCLLFCVNTATADTKTGSWDLTSSSTAWKASGNVGYFSQPYGFKKVNGTLTNKSIADFSTAGITEIKVGFKCLQNGSTKSKLTIYLVDEEGKVISDGVVVTPVNANSASKTTYQYATFTENLEGATGFMMKVTTFDKNILVNGAEYTVTYSSTTPAITPPISELSFGEVENTTSKDLSFNLKGANLTEDVTLTLSDATYFSLSATSASSAEVMEEAGKDITVTYNPNGAVGNHTATLTLSSAGAKAQTIALSGTGIATYKVSWEVNGKPYSVGNPSTAAKSGQSVETLPTAPDAIGTKVFVGWTDAEIGAAQTTAPEVLFTSASEAPVVNGDVTYYAVYATKSGSAPVETLTQTLAYDTWNHGGTTTDKGTVNPPYRLFHTGGYIESKSFDLSTLSKVVVYGGTFGGDSYNKLNIGDGTNTWKDVTVSGSSQTGVNEFTKGTPLSGVGVLKITSKSGTATGTGVRISKVEIYTLSHSYTDYCTTIPDVELAVGATGYATLYYSNFDLVVPENAEAYTFRSENGALMESATYAAGTVIPAGEAVVVYTTNAVPCTLNFRKFIANVACDPSSQLAGTDEATELTQDPDYYFYGLSLNSNSDINSVGFYWMVDGGAAFTNGAHKAYLKIPKSQFAGTQPVRGFAFKGTTTGVESVESSNNAPQAIYDLTGRRVSKAEKGIYIINGKKVIK